jgi:hypothetical protein
MCAWWNVSQILQSGVFQKCSRSEQYMMQGDQPPLICGVAGAVAGRAADVLDADASDPLAVGDDGQHLGSDAPSVVLRCCKDAHNRWPSPPALEGIDPSYTRLWPRKRSASQSGAFGVKSGVKTEK